MVELSLSDSSEPKIRALQQNKRGTLIKKNRECAYTYTIFNTCYNIKHLQRVILTALFFLTRWVPQTVQGIWLSLIILPFGGSVRSQEFYVLTVWDFGFKRANSPARQREFMPNFLCPLTLESSILKSYTNNVQLYGIKYS